MKFFSNSICERIGSYVYALADSNNKFFYIGKGKGNRVFCHEKEADNSPDDNEKLNHIRAVKESGTGGLQYYIIRHGLTDDQAFLVESVLIDLFKSGLISTGWDLKNIQNGHDSDTNGCKTIEEIQIIYEAKPIELIPEDGEVVFICVNNSAHNSNWAEAIHHSWAINIDRGNKCKYVVAVKNGITREAFHVKSDSFKRITNGNPPFSDGEIGKCYFEGPVVKEQTVRDRLVGRVIRMPQKGFTYKVDNSGSPVATSKSHSSWFYSLKSFLKDIIHRMMNIKLLLTITLLMMAYVANAQTIQVYKDGAVVKEYSSAEVDSVVYKPAAAQPRYYYYAGWTQPSESNLADLVAEADGVKAYGVTKDTNVGFSITNPFARMTNTLTDKEWVIANNYQTRNQYAVVPKGMKLYSANDGVTLIVTYSIDNTIVIENHDVYKSDKTIANAARFVVY